MGCVLGRRRFEANNLVEGQDENALEIITKLGFTLSDVDLLYTAFWDIDADGSGLIRPAELFAYFEVEGTPFERKIFALFDEDKSGVINFLEFVCTLWNILTLPQGDFGSVAFLLRDPSGRNLISFTDVRIIIEMLHNRKIDKDPSLNSVFLQMKKELDNKISIHDFNRWTAANPSIVAPLVMLQLHIRLQIIGERFWIRLSNLRKDDAEQGQLDYVKHLQEYVTEKNRIFREKLEAEEAEQRRLSRIGRNVQHYNQKDNIARKESRLLGYFQMKPSKRVTRVVPEQNVSKENARKERAIPEEPDEGKYVTDHHSHQHHHVHSSTNTVASNKSRGNSADVTESNELLHTSNKLSSNKNKPIIFKYDSGNDPPQLFGQSGKSKKKDAEGDLGNKISSKHSDKKNKEKSHKKEYQETVKKVTRKQSSMFDIFASTRKLNYDVLDEADEEHLAKPREKVPIRRRRSVLKKPNLIKKE